MSELIFKPKYNWFSIIVLNLLAISFGVILFAGGVFVNIEKDILLKVSLLGFGVFCVGGTILSFASRASVIYFQADSIIIVRLLFPKNKYLFGEFSDIGNEGVLFRGGLGISFRQMTNAEELIDVFQNLIKENKVHPTGAFLATVKRTKASLKYSLVLSLVVWFLVNYLLNNYLNLSLNSGLLGLLIFLATIYSVAFILKKKEEIK